MFGRMVSFSGFSFTSVTLAEAIGKLRRVEPGCPEIMTALSIGTSFGNSDLGFLPGPEANGYCACPSYGKKKLVSGAAR